MFHLLVVVVVVAVADALSGDNDLSAMGYSMMELQRPSLAARERSPILERQTLSQLLQMNEGVGFCGGDLIFCRRRSILLSPLFVPLVLNPPHACLEDLPPVAVLCCFGFPIFWVDVAVLQVALVHTLEAP